jgi:hypothetical protein
MSILEKKKKVMGNVGALNIITEGLPKFKPTNSFSSIDTKGNSTEFLLELIQSLIGYEELKENIVDILTRKLPEIESEIKSKLKLQLKEFTSCGINPEIPQFLKSTGQGVSFKVSNVDFFDVLKIDPKSPFGFLTYSDPNSGLNSKDLNTFIYTNIEQNKNDFTPNGGMYSSWGLTNVGVDFLDIKFSPVSTTTNNIITIKTHPNFDNKKLSEFTNTFIDSVPLFGTLDNVDGSKILNGIIDSLFGTLSNLVGKTKKQLKKEAEINELINCICNLDDEENIGDSFFEFDNKQLSRIEFESSNRKNGIRIIQTCGNAETNISSDILLDVNTELIDALTATTSTQETKVNAMNKAIDQLANTQSLDSLIINRPTIKLNFILEIVRRLTQTIVNIVLSPKLMILFGTAFKILYGASAEYEGPIDFIKKNKQLFISIAKAVLEPILKMLLTLAIKYISKKLAKKYGGDIIEQNKNYINIILSLVGVPSDILSEIDNLKYIGS